MFTGLVEHVGEITAREARARATRLVISAPAIAGELAEGDSVAIDGACLTVVALGPPETAGAGVTAFAVDAVPATLSRTTLGVFEPGRAVNLERAVRAGEPLGGHLVQGHVDGVGEIVEMGPKGAANEDGGEESGESGGLTLLVRLPADVARFTVERGSLTVDGVSLTVAELSAEVAKLAIIPYTLGHTNLGRLEVSSRVNLEADLIGKYVVRMLDPYLPEGNGGRHSDTL